MTYVCEIVLEATVQCIGQRSSTAFQRALTGDLERCCMISDETTQESTDEETTELNLSSSWELLRLVCRMPTPFLFLCFEHPRICLFSFFVSVQCCLHPLSIFSGIFLSSRSLLSPTFSFVIPLYLSRLFPSVRAFVPLLRPAELAE